MTKSALQIARAAYQPKLPKALKGAVKVKEGEPTQSVADQEAIKALFPNTYGMPLIQFVEGEAVNLPAINVGVILSGGQAPGGHNVISGLFDGIKALNKDSKLFGFILGPGGLVDHNYMELTADIIDEYRNTGGFDIIGSGRTKLEKEEQFDKGLEIIKELGIKALVIIGGDDSNTNACVLAEYYAAKNCGVQVIGCPKTIDGDLKNEMIETSFGFDTACKTYAEVIGNIQRDCNSARKYWHFIKLMGRSASHIALECALQVQPNVCIISEEVEAKDMSLDDVVTYIAQIVADRAAQGNNFGTVLIPEGLVEFIPAMKRLIAELNDFLAANAAEFALIKKSHQREYIISKLSKENSAIYASLPEGVARQLGEDVTIEVPLGTVARDAETGETICEITQDGESFILVKGGRGGLGNWNFRSATNQTPRFAQPGEPRVERTVILELKVLADVGLVGFPNAGKSTLLSVVSAAKPEIANYPFTTLVPNLGIVNYRDGRSFVMADIPGIIEGAHQGKGLGIRFLRHIERNSVLLFLVPADSQNIHQEYNILLNELKQYNPELLDKKRVLAISKSDCADKELMAEMECDLPDIPYVFISSVTGTGLTELKDILWKVLNE